MRQKGHGAGKKGMELKKDMTLKKEAGEAILKGASMNTISGNRVQTNMFSTLFDLLTPGKLSQVPVTSAEVLIKRL